MAERQMRVCVRVRPLTASEHLEGDEAWLLEGTSRITERDVGEKNRCARTFNFDRVFPAPSLNDAVYESMGREIGIREVSVASVGDVFDTIVEGEARRAVGETEFNSRSSRSHAILRLTIESSAAGAGRPRART
ncbi:hypothetical protein JL721_8794 [Aureococcus anophagefferens]|nr:hypothetical protein JL721_8794 [Aureococcus anophagefferens]